MYVRVGDVRLYFDVDGSALVPDGPVMRERPTVVCLHGGPGLDHSVLRPALSALADVAQVVYLDQRGHGRSDRSEPARWSLDQWADDLHGFCSSLGIERPVVLGTSFGGYVAMAYAVRFPDRLDKLVLLSTSPRGTGNPDRRRNVFDGFERRGGPAAREAVRRAFDDRTPAAFAEYLRVCGPLYTRRPPHPDAGRRVVANKEMVPFFEAPGAEGVTFDLSADLGRIRCPVLVVGGDDDPITPPAEQRLIVESLPAGLARFEALPGCGHGIVQDEPARLMRLVSCGSSPSSWSRDDRIPPDRVPRTGALRPDPASVSLQQPIDWC
ncbi:MAG: alpha/beta hydrolase [Actinomycetota bacterium]|nr:alpha/beta hydrolase [Actinomycetota bacterium]